MAQDISLPPPKISGRCLRSDVGQVFPMHPALTVGGQSFGGVLGKTCWGEGRKEGGRECIPTGARDQPGSLGGLENSPWRSPAGPLGWAWSRAAQPLPAMLGEL